MKTRGSHNPQRSPASGSKKGSRLLGPSLAMLRKTGRGCPNPQGVKSVQVSQPGSRPPPGGWLGKGTRQPGRCSRPPQVSRLHPPQASRLCEGPGRTMKLSRTGGSGANGRGAHAHSHAHARTRCPASPTHRQRGFPRASPLHVVARLLFFRAGDACPCV